MIRLFIYSRWLLVIQLLRSSRPRPSLEWRSAAIKDVHRDAFMIEQACENTWLYGVSDLPSFRLRRPCVLFLRYQKLWKSYVKLRHLLANSPKVKQTDKQKLAQREVGIGPSSPMTNDDVLPVYLRLLLHHTFRIRWKDTLKKKITLRSPPYVSMLIFFIF